MGKKYLETKGNSLESSILGLWKEAAGTKKDEELSKKQKKLDVDGDGEIEGSDLAKLRKKGAKKEGNAFGKALMAAKEKGDKTFVVAGKTYEVKEESDLDEEGLEDSPNKANSQHLCAKNVMHEEWGEGHPVHGMHAIPNFEGEIAWYDVMFEHGIEKGVSINELNVIKESMHNSHNKDHDKEDDDKEVLSAGKMSQMHQMIKDKKGAEEIAKAMKLDVKTVKALMSNYDMGEARQLKDPENEIMVVKNGKVEVIDKKDKEKYMKKGYDLAEGKKYEHGIGKVNSAFEIGTPEYRQHTQSITPGQEITDYQRFKVESMKEALAKVWGLDEKLEEVEEKSLTKKVKGSTMTMTGKKSDEIDTKPEIDKEK